MNSNCLKRSCLFYLPTDWQQLQSSAAGFQVTSCRASLQRFPPLAASPRGQSVRDTAWLLSQRSPGSAHFSAPWTADIRDQKAKLSLSWHPDSLESKRFHVELFYLPKKTNAFLPFPPPLVVFLKHSLFWEERHPESLIVRKGLWISLSNLERWMAFLWFFLSFVFFLRD